MQNSKPAWVRASRTGSESGGLRSEKRVLVKALLGLGESESMGFGGTAVFASLLVLGVSLRNFGVYGDKLL